MLKNKSLINALFIVTLSFISAFATTKKSSLPSKSNTDKPVEVISKMSEEISFGKNLVVEGKVEKPQVQFPLVKEAPPEKPIQFETSFLPKILYLERENTFTE